MGNYCYYVFVIVAVLATVKTAESLWCWECVSSEGDSCADYFNVTQVRRYGYDARSPKEKNCEDGRSQFYVGQQRSVCMKKVQTIYGKKQYTRGCGFINPSEPLECPTETTNSQMTTDFCSYCDNVNYCNGAQTLRVDVVWMALLPTLVALLIARK